MEKGQLWHVEIITEERDGNEETMGIHTDYIKTKLKQNRLDEETFEMLKPIVLGYLLGVDDGIVRAKMKKIKDFERDKNESD